VVVVVANEGYDYCSYYYYYLAPIEASFLMAVSRIISILSVAASKSSIFADGNC